LDNELKMVYRTGDLTVVTLRVEEFGLTVIEAIVNGCLDIVAKILFSHEISEEAFAAFSPPAAMLLALKIEHALSDPEQYNKFREYGKK